MDAIYDVRILLNHQLVFNLKAPNGMVILTSEHYHSMSALENGIESVRKNGIIKDQFQIQKNVGKHYFFLKAPNGQVIGTGPMTGSRSDLDRIIRMVMKHCTTEIVVKGDFV